MAQNQVIIRKDKNNLKITSSGVPSDVTGSSYFQIVDEKGNVYRFDQVEMSLMQMDDAINPNSPITMSYMYPSSWYLSSITSADGTETLTFSYFDNTSGQVQFGAYLPNQSYTYTTAPFSSAGYYDGAGSTTSGTPPTVTLYHHRYLQGISLIINGNVLATATLTLAANQRSDLDDLAWPGEQRPTSIAFAVRGSIFKSYNFYYSYFGTGTNPDLLRMRLDSVQEKPMAGSTLVKPPYIFTYNSGTIPSVPTGSIDHWGFSMEEMSRLWCQVLLLAVIPMVEEPIGIPISNIVR